MSQDSQKVLSEQMIRVRTIAQKGLARYAKLDPNDCKEVYLFSKDQFCGVRFTLGAFTANWRITETIINLSRGEHQIEQFELESSSEQRAA